jgi:hypothetical protein
LEGQDPVGVESSAVEGRQSCANDQHDLLNERQADLVMFKAVIGAGMRPSRR